MATSKPVAWRWRETSDDDWIVTGVPPNSEGEGCEVEPLFASKARTSPGGLDMATVTSAGEHLHKAIHPLYCAKGSYDGPAIRNLIEAALAQARAEGKAEGMWDGMRKSAGIALDERHNREGSDSAFELGACAASFNIEDAILNAIVLPPPPADGEAKPEMGTDKLPAPPAEWWP